MNLVYTYLISLSLFIIWFIVSYIKKNNGLVDILWGLSFVVIAWSSMLLNNNITLLTVTLNTVVSLWGLRLFSYLLIRNWNKPEDFRYQNMRKKWKNNIGIKSFLRVFLLQSIISLIVSTPIILANSFESNLSINQQLFIIIPGLILFLIGFTFEVLGDYQLKKFKQNPLNKGKVLKTGVWSLTRHPNYFGESLLWWGFGVISLANFSIISLLGLLSPLVMTLLLLFVSGVPLLEKRYKDNLEYQEYSKVTPIFFPYPKNKKTLK